MSITAEGNVAKPGTDEWATTRPQRRFRQYWYSAEAARINLARKINLRAAQSEDEWKWTGIISPIQPVEENERSLVERRVRLE